jgi:hypothetical protein
MPIYEEKKLGSHKNTFSLNYNYIIYHIVAHFCNCFWNFLTVHLLPSTIYVKRDKIRAGVEDVTKMK